MKCYLGNLPESLFPLIREYLICGGISSEGSPFGPQVKEDIESWNNLLNTNKSLFHKPNSTIKARYFYYKLSRKLSTDYILNQDNLETSEIILHIRKEVECPTEQIRLDLTKFRDEKLLSSFFSQLDPKFNHVHSLSLNYVYFKKLPRSLEGKIHSFMCHCSRDLEDITSLRGTSQVYLADMPIEDLSPLQDSKIVRLYSLPSLRDLSCFSRLHSLELIDCAEVDDVSMLGGLYSLSIYDCPKVTDVSALGGVQKLILETAGDITTFLPYDNQIKYFSCPALYLPEILKFQNKSNLKLGLRDAEVDCNLFFFRGWKEVSFINAAHPIIDRNFIEPICYEDRELMKDPTFLQQAPVRRFKLDCLWNLKRISGFSSIYYLKIKMCPELREIDLGSFTQLKYCFLNDCSLTRITVQGSIERLSIKENKKKIEILNVLKQMTQLLIYHCFEGGNIKVHGIGDKSFISFVRSPKFSISEV